MMLYIIYPITQLIFKATLKTFIVMVPLGRCGEIVKIHFPGHIFHKYVKQENLGLNIHSTIIYNSQNCHRSQSSLSQSPSRGPHCAYHSSVRPYLSLFYLMVGWKGTLMFKGNCKRRNKCS